MAKLLFGLLCLAVSVSVFADTKLHVDVFYGWGQHPVNIKQAKQFASVEVFDLTAPERFKDKLNIINLSNDPKVAERQAKQFLKKNNAKLKRELTGLYNGTLRAAEYKITKLPAIVFNYGDHVVYGITDITQAIKIYRKEMR